MAVMLTFVIGQSGWALPEHEGSTARLNPDELRGPASGLDYQCDWDYQGFRFTGSGGFGGFGTTLWPNGSYGGNYGQLRFVQDCNNQIDTAYAYCFDLDHGLMQALYCVNIDSAVISPGDTCRAAQLRALAYLLAWCDPQNALEDDIVQLAIWKLTTNHDPGSDDYGVPFFCMDTPIDPEYPYENVVMNTNIPRNTGANTKVLEALEGNVAMEDDQLLPSNDPAVVGETESTVTIRVCVDRGDRAGAVGNDRSDGIKILAAYSIGIGPLIELVLYTDETGCAEFDVSQPIQNQSYEDVTAFFCTKAAWPMDVFACVLPDKQNLVLVPPEVPLICAELLVPGDNWLPVELTSFAALNSPEGIDLTWTTASEIVTDSWEIERRVAGAEEFARLAIVDAENSATGHSYTYFDRLGVSGRSYDYRLVDVGFDGVRTIHPNIESASYGNLPSRVREYELADAYPNPFNPGTTIRYSIPDGGLVSIKVYDLEGRVVAELADGYHEAGHHTVKFDGSNLASGTYFYRMTAAGFSMTKRFMLLR